MSIEKPNASDPRETVKSYFVGQPATLIGGLGLGALPITLLMDELGPKAPAPAPMGLGGPDLNSAPKPSGM